MREYLLPEKGKFFKANLHCHSTFSDGKLTPEELKQAYKSHGYSVLAITDHEGIFDHSYLNEEDFLTIPGYEREINDTSQYSDRYGWSSMRTTHLCFYPKDKNNIRAVCFNPDFIHPKFRWMHDRALKAKVKYIGEPYVPVPTVECINHIIAEANKNGFLVTFNHPEWSQQPYEVFCQYQGMFGMEIYNTASERGGFNEYNSKLYDMILRSGHKICCIAADDNHNNRPLDSVYSDSFGGYVMIRAESLTHENIINALENGNFYSSTGPEITVLYRKDDTVHIETSAAKKIRILTGNGCARVVIAGDKLLTSADFKVDPIFLYFRIEVTDEKGEKAYTNAYFTDRF